MRDAETVIWTPVAADKDKYGDTDPTPGTPVSLEALVAARSSSENAGNNAPGVIVGKSLYILSTDALPKAADRFTVRGESYEVVGEAHRWGSSGVEVAIQRTGAQ